MDTAKQTEQIQKTTQSKSGNVISDHGRRKEATARVRLIKGKGQTTVNGKFIEEYFPSQIAKFKWQKPFVLTKSQEAYYATIKVSGSGKNSQLGAITHGISRALTQADSNFRPILKKAGLLTRDPRAKERRKYGLAQKARKGKQSPKR